MLLDAFFILSQFYYFNVKNIHIKKNILTTKVYNVNILLLLGLPNFKIRFS